MCYILNCTTPRKIVVYTPMGAQRWEAAQWYQLSSVYDVTITLRCVVWICAVLLFCEWNTRWALIARWLYLAKRKKNHEILLIQGTRFLSILFNFVDIRGVVQHKWLMVLVWAMVQYFAFGERLMFYSTRLRPPPPRASPRWIEHQSFTSCEFSYHCTINH